MKRMGIVLALVSLISLLALPVAAMAASAPGATGLVIASAAPEFYDDYDGDGVAEAIYFAGQFSVQEAVGAPGQRGYKAEKGWWISGWYDPQAGYWYQKAYDAPATNVDVDSAARQAWFTVGPFRMRVVDGGSPWTKDSFYQDDVVIPLYGGNLTVR